MFWLFFLKPFKYYYLDSNPYPRSTEGNAIGVSPYIKELPSTFPLTTVFLHSLKHKRNYPTPLVLLTFLDISIPPRLLI